MKLSHPLPAGEEEVAHLAQELGWFGVWIVRVEGVGEEFRVTRLA